MSKPEYEIGDVVEFYNSCLTGVIQGRIQNIIVTTYSKKSTFIDYVVGHLDDGTFTQTVSQERIKLKR